MYRALLFFVLLLVAVRIYASVSQYPERSTALELQDAAGLKKNVPEGLRLAIKAALVATVASPEYLALLDLGQLPEAKALVEETVAAAITAYAIGSGTLGAGIGCVNPYMKDGALAEVTALGTCASCAQLCDSSFDPITEIYSISKTGMRYAAWGKAGSYSYFGILEDGEIRAWN